jgi:uncharacterized protein
LTQAKAEVESINATLRSQETRATDLNLELKSVVTQTTELDARLYGGKVGNPKELRDIEHKIDELKRHQADLENTLLETMISIEELQASQQMAETHLGEVETEQAGRKENLTGEQIRLKHEIRALKTDREAILPQIGETTVALYQTLRATKQGHAVVLLKGETCSYCRVDQTSNVVQQVRQGKELVYCLSCGRILVAI